VLGQEPETVDFYRDFTAVGPLYFITKQSERSESLLSFLHSPPTALPLPVITIPSWLPLFHRPGIDIAHLIAR